jgi:regulator of RNase E activity RraA
MKTEPIQDASSGSLCMRLRRLQTDTIGDVLDEMGYRHQLLTAEIHSVDRGMRVAGPAFTIKGQASPHSTVQASGDAPKPSFELFRHMHDGCVAVMDTGNHAVGAPWGENSALSARARGCAGIVIDGGTRDGLQLIEMGFPTFARFVSAARVEGRWSHTAFQVPITLPGQTAKEVHVNPDDLILADFDGVVVIPRPIAGEVIVAAERVEEIEDEIRRALVAGMDREEVYQRNPRYAHISRNDEHSHSG